MFTIVTYTLKYAYVFLLNEKLNNWYYMLHVILCYINVKMFLTVSVSLGCHNQIP